MGHPRRLRHGGGLAQLLRIMRDPGQPVGRRDASRWPRHIAASVGQQLAVALAYTPNCGGDVHELMADRRFKAAKWVSTTEHCYRPG